MKSKQKFNMLEKYAENISSLVNGIVCDTSKQIGTVDTEEVEKTSHHNARIWCSSAVKTPLNRTPQTG